MSLVILRSQQKLSLSREDQSKTMENEGLRATFRSWRNSTLTPLGKQKLESPCTESDDLWLGKLYECNNSMRGQTKERSSYPGAHGREIRGEQVRIVIDQSREVRLDDAEFNTRTLGQGLDRGGRIRPLLNRKQTIYATCR